MKTDSFAKMKVTALCALMALGAGMAPTASAADNRQPLYLSYAWVPANKDANAGAALSADQKRKLAAQLSYQGRGAYICTPSGSGAKPRCFTRR